MRQAPRLVTSLVKMGESQGSPRRKLTGRAFYESIGSPKVVLAPMVDQSEFVGNFRYYDSTLLLD